MANPVLLSVSPSHLSRAAKWELQSTTFGGRRFWGSSADNADVLKRKPCGITTTSNEAEVKRREKEDGPYVHGRLQCRISRPTL
jgi:hypothetical protein